MLKKGAKDRREKNNKNGPAAYGRTSWSLKSQRFKGGHRGRQCQWGRKKKGEFSVGNQKQNPGDSGANRGFSAGEKWRRGRKAINPEDNIQSNHYLTENSRGKGTGGINAGLLIARLNQKQDENLSRKETGDFLVDKGETPKKKQAHMGDTLTQKPWRGYALNNPKKRGECRGEQ